MKRNAIRLFAFGMALTAPLSAAWADKPLEWGGQVFGNIYFPTQNPGQSQFLQVDESIWLHGSASYHDVSSVHFTLSGDNISASETAPVGVRGDVREAYFENYKNGFDFRAGRQFISWGKSDGINPTDYLSAFDYTFFNPDQEVQRIASDSLYLSFVPERGRSHFNFIFVFTAVPPETKILLPSQVVAAQSSQFTITSPSQTTNFANSEGAAKISYTGRGWDASISAFIGKNHTPDFQVTSFTATPTNVTVAYRYQPIWDLGGDFSVSAGQWVIRGESAFTFVRDINEGTDPLIQPNHWDTVLGAERPFGNNFRAQIQGIFRYIPRWAAPGTATDSTVAPAAVNQQIAAANQLIQGTGRSTQPGGSLRISYSAEPVELEIFGLAYAGRNDYFIRPMFTFAWSEPLRTFIGMNYSGGPTNEPLGAYRIYNAVFAGGTYKF